MRENYNTQNKSELFDFLSRNPQGSFTIEELIEAMGENAPGKSTVYRLINRLCCEGTVRRLVREDTKAAVYQLAGRACCSEHLHIKCVDCGLLVHLDRSEQDAIAKTTGFVIDDIRSMLYGRCAECARRAK